MYMHYLRKFVMVSVIVLAVLLVAGMALTAAGAQPYEPRPTWKACRYDDGGNAPCVWDAKHQGNGLGHSFKAVPRRPDCQGPRCVDPRIIYITHGRAHYLLG